jgi:uncharacterized protein (DUF488 family)
MSRTIWTIGHSTRSIEEFFALLTAHEIRCLVDVRRFPASRRHPHFHADVLRASLAEAGIDYEHRVALGGRRSARPDSTNLGWRTAGFRGYADHMQTGEFQRALEELMAYGTKQKTAVMCAEAVPWRCHRQLIADALVARGWTVRHILGPDRSENHRLTAFALNDQGHLTYPLPVSGPDSPRLF